LPVPRWAGGFPPIPWRLILARRVGGRSALARPRWRRAETPSAGTRQRVRGRGPLGVRMKPRHRHPSPIRTPGPRSLRSDGRPTRRADLSPHPDFHDGSRQEGFSLAVAGFLAEGAAAEIAPRATGAVTPERAGPERPVRCVGTLAPTERLFRGRGTARLRARVCACSVAREGGSEGWARRLVRATPPGPLGKRKPPRSGREEHPSHRGTGKTRPSQG
jgi:hypothetical protein